MTTVMLPANLAALGLRTAKARPGAAVYVGAVASPLPDDTRGPEGQARTVAVSRFVLICGAAAVGTFVGLALGGPWGAAVGCLAGALVAALGSQWVKRLIVRVDVRGRVEFEVEFY